MLSSRRRLFSTLSVTTPIFYVNAAPHLGHAYSMVLADAASRWHVLRHGPGAQSHLFTGTDEHGQKVAEAARQAGLLGPQAWCDRVAGQFRQLAELLHVRPRRFIRTTDGDHIAAVRALWNELWQSGDIYLGTHAGWYCVADEAFCTEHEVIDAPDGRGRLSRTSGRPVHWIEEANYMFRLGRYRQRLLDWLRTPGVIVPASRLNDLLGYLQDEREFADLSLSRRRSSCSWGIACPQDPEQIIYVWLDALANYLTVMGYPERRQVPSVHVLGKDILKFHALYWPAFLMAAQMPLPRHLLVHGHWTVAGGKMSKSGGNAVDPHQLVRAHGADALRYFLLRECRLDSDADFSLAEFARVINRDLANQLGNLLTRAFNGKFLGVLHADATDVAPDPQVLADTLRVCKQAAASFDAFQYHVGLEQLAGLLRDANRHFTEEEPWKLQGLPSHHGQIRSLLLNVACRVVAYALMLQPFIPGAASQVLDYFGIVPSLRHHADLPKALDAVASNLARLTPFDTILFARTMLPSPIAAPA